jgi:hypothetical protein
METQLTRRDGAMLARGLGWFSIGLGLAEVAAPGMLAKAIGVEDDRGAKLAMRAAGAREIANGVGLLARPKTPALLWSRVAGDAIDLGLLGFALGTNRAPRNRLLIAIGAVLGVAVLDALGGTRLQRSQREATSKSTITINRPQAEVEAYFSRLGEVTKKGLRFVPARNGRATEVHVEGRATGDLRRIKQILETGEVVVSDASLHTMPHPARPSKGDDR